MSHTTEFLSEVVEIAKAIEPRAIEVMAYRLDAVRIFAGKVFVIGMGGSLANAIHMAADLRKLCNIDAYAPSNIAELTARANDEGLDTIFTGWLPRLTRDDCLFVLSVGGGTQNVSKAITEAVKKAKAAKASILGIVGPVGGITHEMGDHVLRVPVPESASSQVTPHTEAFQAVIWHALVSHPLLQRNACKW